MSYNQYFIPEYSDGSEYSDKEEMNDKNELAFLKVEEEVYNIYKSLIKESYSNYNSNGSTILQYMNMSDIYDFFYNDYSAPF
jgi:hypothetical protein